MSYQQNNERDPLLPNSQNNSKSKLRTQTKTNAQTQVLKPPPFTRDNILQNSSNYSNSSSKYSTNTSEIIGESLVTVHRNASSIIGINRNNSGNDDNVSIVTNHSNITNSNSIISNTNNNNNEDKNSAKNTIIGMVLVAVGTAFICTVGALVQNHGGSVLELMLGRYFLQNLLSWIIWCCRKPDGCDKWYGDVPYRTNIWLRGFLYFVMIFCWWRGLELVPIGDAEAILFISPLTTVLAGRIYLKEKLPKVFLLTFFLTIIGVVFICQPAFVFASNDDYEPISLSGLLFLLGCVVSWSAVCILVRTAKEAHWLQLEIVSSLQSAFILTPLLIILNRVWIHSESLSGGDWDFEYTTFLMMIAIAVLGFLGLMCSVIGYQIGDATKVAWMEYLDLVFAFLYQWFAFDDIPNTWEFIGCALLFGTCFVHLLEEGYHYYYRRKQEKYNILKKQRDEQLLAETSALLSKETKKARLEKLHPLDRTPIQTPVKKLSKKEKLLQFANRVSTFTTITNNEMD